MYIERFAKMCFSLKKFKSYYEIPLRTFISRNLNTSRKTKPDISFIYFYNL